MEKKRHVEQKRHKGSDITRDNMVAVYCREKMT
jgi:hypothetical protein